MKVTIYWSEQVGYESTIEIDEANVIQALGLPAGTRLAKQESHLAKQEIFQYLTNDDSEGWFEQCDTISDFVSVDDRQVDGIVSFQQD